MQVQIEVGMIKMMEVLEMSEQWFQSETVEESLYVLISKAFAKHEKKTNFF